jgi:triacylglycerol esterase/lipase EstA (alpha/beta hydrolase family)
MTHNPLKVRGWVRFNAALICIAFLTSCATQPTGRPQDTAARSLRAARSPQLSLEVRAADYLKAAALSAPDLGSGTQSTPARQTYNSAAAELTVLLRSADGGRLWNRSLTLTANKAAYHLRLQPATHGVWSPDYFTSFALPATIKQKLIKKENRLDGVGGSLVGVRSVTPRENFAPLKGISAPVTATLDFKKNDAMLALRRPAKQPTAAVEGRVRPLAADFSAPISYYRPPGNLLLLGLGAMMRGSNYVDKTGLYFLQPYDPDRIPVVFVHGLMSTPFNWVQTINGLQADPEIRKHYQFWVFGYPTGNPILYSGLRLREELAKVDKLYPNHRPYVLVGHSMGGIVSHLQVTTLTRAMWERDLGDTAESVFARSKSDSIVVRSMTFQANPRVKRVVYVCTPHRGSTLATSGIGKFGVSLIALPFTLTSAMKDTLTSTELGQLTGSAKRLPNSITGLKPTNPTFVTLNKAPMTVTYHSIIGDRGKGDSPNSTDGVVPYWSSHLDGAKSECIVPGPHGSCELPQTITELDRILKLHLKS